MAEKKFQCSMCGRKFSMAAHLARHRSATHARGRVKAARKKTRKRATRRKVRRGTARAVTGASAASARRELRAYHRQLCSRRDQLDAEIADIESVLQTLGGTRRRRRGRPRRR